MQMHPDYDKLSQANEMLKKLQPAAAEIARLEEQIADTEKIIRAGTGNTHAQFEIAQRQEQRRVERENEEMRKVRFGKILPVCVAIHIAFIVAQIILLIADVRIGVEIGDFSEKIPLTSIVSIIASVLMFWTVSMMQRAFKNNKRGTGWLVASVIFALNVRDIVGFAHAIVTIVMLVYSEKTRKKTAQIDPSVLDKANSADRARELARIKEAKEEKAELEEELAARRAAYAPVYAQTKKKLAELGIYENDYQHIAYYQAMIYQETMKSGRLVDLEWAKFTYIQEKGESQRRRAEAAQEAIRASQMRIDESFRREAERRERERLISETEKLRESVRDLEKKLDS